MNNLPQYKCHKIVGAFKIIEMSGINPITRDIPKLDGVSNSVFVDNEFINKHDPQIGGYFVEYEEGYQSYSPADVFEAGYSLIEVGTEDDSWSEPFSVDFNNKKSDPVAKAAATAEAYAEGSDMSTEQKIQAKGLNAPRVTPKHINRLIVEIKYHQFPDTMLIVCCLVLRNGFTVTGESACASPENFDEEIGKEIAFKHAKDKIWMLEGYLLKQHLFQSEQAATTF